MKLVNMVVPQKECRCAECTKNIKIEYQPFEDGDTGEVIVVAEVYTDIETGDSWVTQLFTNGDLYAEMAAQAMGFREEDEEILNEEEDV